MSEAVDLRFVRRTRTGNLSLKGLKLRLQEAGIPGECLDCTIVRRLATMDPDPCKWNGSGAELHDRAKVQSRGGADAHLCSPASCAVLSAVANAQRARGDDAKGWVNPQFDRQ